MAPIIPHSESRKTMHSFWANYSHNPTENSMMLSEKAPELKDDDRYDILRSLPSVKGADVVDIGAGIGRFTASFAPLAKSVTAVDFIESFIETNRQRHSHCSNVRFVNSDAASLQLPSESVDFVFTNWLLMYLDDDETISFLVNTLSWLRPGGMLHVPKKKTGEFAKSVENPTFYRQKSAYIKLFQSINRDQTKFKVLWAKSVGTYVKKENNWRQVHWLLVKVPTEEAPPSKQYLLDIIGASGRRKQHEAEQVRYTWMESTTHQQLVDTITHGEAPNHNYLLVNGCTHLCPLNVARATTNSRVLSMDTDARMYRAATSDMNDVKNQSVRSFWLPSLTGADTDQLGRPLLDWPVDTLIGVELLLSAEDEMLQKLMELLSPDENGDRRVRTLERNADVSKLDQILNEHGLEQIKITPINKEIIQGSDEWCMVEALIPDEEAPSNSINLG